MATIADLAREFGAQPYEVEAFYGGPLQAEWDAELPTQIENTIRDAWAVSVQVEQDNRA